MSAANRHNRVVWLDIPVSDLGRAMDFYRQVLAIEVIKESFNNIEFAVLEHGEGVGGCLVVAPQQISDKGSLIYLNVNGRIRQAVARVSECGGQVVENIHAIGGHGYKAVILDSEGNRMALHSLTEL